MNDHWSHEETDNPLYADDRNFYKLEKWTKDGMQVDRLLYALAMIGQGQGVIYARRQASAARKINHPAAHARPSTMAALSHCWLPPGRRSAGSAADTNL